MSRIVDLVDRCDTGGMGGAIGSADESEPSAWLRRLQHQRPIVAGTAGRIASALGAHVLLVRVGLAVLTLAAGFGVAVYGVVTLLTAGRAPAGPTRPVTVRNDLAVALLTVSGLAAVTAVVPGLPTPLLWLVTLIALGLGIASAPEPGEAVGAADALRSRPARTVAGICLVVVAVGTALAVIQTPADLFISLVAMLILVLGLALVLGPWLRQLSATAERERLERMRADDRADVAAHLHDSVLQTLTLIQNRAAEPSVTAALAHRQERELREWLYGRSRRDDGSSLRDHLEQVAAEIEDQYLLAVETIVVGDAAVTPTTAALAAAAREALVNSAKFSGGQLVSLYAELSPVEASVFVRDKGIGFDLDAVPDDRRGIRFSIEERLTRAGGTATIKTKVGAGTEVAMVVPLTPLGAPATDERNRQP